MCYLVGVGGTSGVVRIWVCLHGGAFARKYPSVPTYLRWARSRRVKDIWTSIFARWYHLSILRPWYACLMVRRCGYSGKRSHKRVRVTGEERRRLEAHFGGQWGLCALQRRADGRVHISGAYARGWAPCVRSSKRMYYRWCCHTRQRARGWEGFTRS